MHIVVDVFVIHKEVIVSIVEREVEHAIESAGFGGAPVFSDDFSAEDYETLTGDSLDEDRDGEIVVFMGNRTSIENPVSIMFGPPGSTSSVDFPDDDSLALFIGIIEDAVHFINGNYNDELCPRGVVPCPFVFDYVRVHRFGVKGGNAENE